MKITHAYYRADGRSREQVEQWHERVQEFHQAANASKDEVGASEVAHYSHERIAGFKFPDDETPAGWRRLKNGLCWPTRHSHQGRELDRRVSARCGPNLDSCFGVTELMLVGRRFFTTGLTPLEDGAFIIHVPLDQDGEPFYEPQDAQRLKPSEYLHFTGQ